MTNAEIADRLMSMAQLLSARKENPFKIKAYRRAAKTVRAIPDSLAALVAAHADLTAYAGIGKGIGAAIQEIVLNGSSRQLDELRAQVSPEVAAIAEYPKLDPARVLRIYKKLGIASVEELKQALASGEIAAQFGPAMATHIRQALTDSHEILLYEADAMVASAQEFLLTRCGVKRAQAVGAYWRRVEVVDEISFVIETDDLPGVLAKVEAYGGGSHYTLHAAKPSRWGVELIERTGSAAHLAKLGSLPKTGRYPDEASVYRKLGLPFIEPELREGLDEMERAARAEGPALVTVADIRGELHAHSTSSDGVHTIEQMAGAARAKGYDYTGITDHSQSLKIAHGLPVEDLWKQIRYIDKLNASARGFLILKSTEVDILGDGALDYPDELLKELDYTVCSIHSKFSLGKAEQTERILRAMDNRYFNILGHATGRKLLKRPGYEIDMERVAEHAKKNGCFFEINASPDRLDLSAAHARVAAQAGVLIAVSTDAHSTGELEFTRCGIDQARRAGLTAQSVLNTRSWQQLRRLMKR